MAVIQLKITAEPGTDFATIDVVDTTDYSAANTTINSLTVKVYPPESATFIELNLTTFWEAQRLTNPLKIEHSIPASLVGYSGSFGDGEYQLIFSMQRTIDGDPDVVDTGTLTTWVLMYGHALACIQKQIAGLPDILTGACGCDTTGEDETQTLFDMYMMLQSAVFSHVCSKYVEAERKLKSVTEYCNNCECGCG